MTLAETLAQPNPVTIAHQLIGMKLTTGHGDTETTLRITETEAYFAPNDQASHAKDNRRTARTEVFWSAPGTAYVYLIYGMHEMFNVVTGPEGTPHAILIRSGEPIKGLPLIKQRRNIDSLSKRLSSGPGVVTKALDIDRSMNGLNLLDPKSPVRLSLPDKPVPTSSILATPRIGIDYAGEPWVSKPWRFIDKTSKFLSGPKGLNEG